MCFVVADASCDAHARAVAFAREQILGANRETRAVDVAINTEIGAVHFFDAAVDFEVAAQAPCSVDAVQLGAFTVDITQIVVVALGANAAFSGYLRGWVERQTDSAIHRQVGFGSRCARDDRRRSDQSF